VTLRTAALAVVAVTMLLAACGGPPGAGPVPPGTTPGTAMTTLGPQLAGTAALIESRLAAAGLGLQQSFVDYRPGEPAAVQFVARAVWRVEMPDPNEGWLLIYDLRTEDAAQRAGQDFAAYLASGLGRTNYPRDAQFALSRVDGALIYYWWSPERTSNADRAQAAFDAVRGVGQPIEVPR
jgi:hypothetical protein